MPGHPPILLSANSAWNVRNFRMPLIRGLQDRGYPVAVAAPADGSEQSLQEAGAQFIPLPLSRSGINPVAELALLRRYFGLMRSLRPAAFLGFTIKPNIYGSIAARMAGVPTVNNISGLGTMFLGSGGRARLALALYGVALRRSAAVFFQNPDDQALFLDSGKVRHQQARLLPGSGIDLDRFAPAAPVTDGALTFLFIGRLLRDKGVCEFVDAARLVREALPTAEFQLLGAPDPGNRTSIPEDQLAGWAREGLVQQLGECDDVRPHIAGATAVVLPSYREGLPRVLLEAGAMGKPLIATDVPGCRTIVAHGRNGLLCEPRNARSLADAMTALGRMGPEKLALMGRESRAIVEREYSEQKIIDAYLTALREIEPASSVDGRTC